MFQLLVEIQSRVQPIPLERKHLVSEASLAPGNMLTAEALTNLCEFSICMLVLFLKFVPNCSLFRAKVDWNQQRTHLLDSFAVNLSLGLGEGGQVGVWAV